MRIERTVLPNSTLWTVSLSEENLNALFSAFTLSRQLSTELRGDDPFFDGDHLAVYLEVSKDGDSE